MKLSSKLAKLQVVIIVVLVIAILVLGYIFFIKLNEKILSSDENNKITIENNIIDSEESVITNEEVEEVKEEKTSMSLVMVGDHLIHSSVYKDAAKNAGGRGYDFKPMLKYIKEKVKSYDLAYYNQETILGGAELGVSDYPNFNSPYEAGEDMIDAGFNLVSLATNHTMDSGAKAVINSRNYWDRQENVLTVRKL